MRTVLLAVDGTRRGLETVSSIGRLLNKADDLKIVLFHCVQQVATLLPGDICTDIEETLKLGTAEQEKLGQAVLKASLARLIDAGFPEANIELRLKLESLDPAKDILDQADIERTRTIVVGRRGRSQVETLLLGSISSNVAQYARDKVVWVVDTKVNESARVLIAMEGVPEVCELAYYTAEMFGGIPGMEYIFMHIIPPVPPTFWDDGHILDPTEQKDRRSRIDKWRAEWTAKISDYMSEGRDLLLERGVREQDVKRIILNTNEGIARDLLGEIQAHKAQIVVMGKRSFRERKPFLMGSHALKILQNASGVILCLVG